MSHRITIIDNLLHYDVPLVISARDDAGRLFVGLSYVETDAEGLETFALAHIDRATLTEFERGQVDLLSVLKERCASALALTCTALGAPGEVVVAEAVATFPSEALPLPGLVLAQTAQLTRA